MAISRPHPHHLHGIRVILFGVLLIALGVMRLNTDLIAVVPAKGSVLAYATNVSIGDLIAYTNNARAQNGLGALSNNQKLNNSAQSKANDMIARDYWSHNTPDGTQPWWFFTQAGYSYTNAGENLAYGFSDSASTVDAWMNSAGHRANILGSYTEIGIGIASGANYQGGENTVVVAHYATPAAPAPPPAAPTPQVQSTTPQAPAAPQTPPATPAPTETTPVAETPKTPQKKTETNQTPKTPVSTPTASTSIPLWRTFQGGNVPLIGIISLSLLVLAAMGYALTHRALVRHAVLVGETYALHHPVLDVSVLIVVGLLVMLSTVARIG